MIPKFKAGDKVKLKDESLFLEFIKLGRVASSGGAYVIVSIEGNYLTLESLDFSWPSKYFQLYEPRARARA